MTSKALLCVLVGVAAAAKLPSTPRRGIGRPQHGSFGSHFDHHDFGGSAAHHSGGGFAGQDRYRPTPGPFIPILVDERDGPHADGTYSFNFETGNGISRQEQGYPQGPEGAVASQGGWSFTFPDGTPAVFTFVADENGYRVESPLLPTPPPLPAHAIAQIEFASQQRAQGASHGGQHGGSGGFGGSFGGSRKSY